MLNKFTLCYNICIILTEPIYFKVACAISRCTRSEQTIDPDVNTLTTDGELKHVHFALVQHLLIVGPRGFIGQQSDVDISCLDHVWYQCQHLLVVHVSVKVTTVIVNLCRPTSYNKVL